MHMLGEVTLMLTIFQAAVITSVVVEQHCVVNIYELHS